MEKVRVCKREEEDSKDTVAGERGVTLADMIAAERIITVSVTKKEDDNEQELNSLALIAQYSDSSDCD